MVGGEGVLRTEVGHGVLSLQAKLREGEGGEEVRGLLLLLLLSRGGAAAAAAGSWQTAV